MTNLRKPRASVFVLLFLTASLLAVALLQSTPGTEAATIILQTPETQNVDDGMVIQVSPALEYGALNQMSAGAPGINRDRQAFVKWSLSSLPAGATITNASLQLYHAANGLETDDRLSVGAYAVTPFPTYAINGQVWTEGTGGEAGDACADAELCWNTRPTGSQVSGAAESSVSFDGSASLSGWYSWTVTQMVQQAVNNSNGTLTVGLLSSWLGGSESSSDFVTFRSKEHTNSTLWPRLVIDYVTDGTPTSPTPTPTPTATPTPTSTPTPTPTPTGTPTPTTSPTSTPPPSSVDGCATQPVRAAGAFYYSSIFNYDQVGWYNPQNSHSNAAFLTPYPVCAAVHVSALRIPILAPAAPGCTIQVGLYTDVEINGNHYPRNLLVSATIAADVVADVDVPVSLDLSPAVYHVVWASNKNYGCDPVPGVHGSAAWNLYIDSINDNGRNEVIAAYPGTGLWPVFPSNKGYGKGAFYLQMYYDQYLP